MSGVLHPEGPEPAQTYWLRRVLVLLALLVLILVSVGVAGASMGATRQQSPVGSAGVPSESTAASVSSAPTSPSASASASPNSKSASPSPSSSSSSETSGSATRLPSCARKNLKTTLSGKQMLKLGQPAAFTVRLANDGDAACRLILGRSDFELKITTGKKLVWSSKSCSTATFLIAGQLELDQSLSWPMLWDGRATAAGCAAPGAVPKASTYLVTATIADGKSAELPVTLRA